MTQAIRDAGFTPVPEDIHFTLTGTLETRGGGAVLVLAGMTAPREVVCVAAPGNDRISSALGAHAGRAVELKGRWRFEGSGTLEVESISPLPAGP
jgi:hypothetical protein